MNPFFVCVNYCEKEEEVRLNAVWFSIPLHLAATELFRHQPVTGAAKMCVLCVRFNSSLWMHHQHQILKFCMAIMLSGMALHNT